MPFQSIADIRQVVKRSSEIPQNLSKIRDMIEGMGLMPMRLRELRDRLGYSQEGVASSIGMKARTLGDWESSRPPEAFQHLYNLCKKYGISADYILGLSDSRLPVKNLNIAAQSETITELIDVVLDMSDARRREILAVARTLAAMEEQESSPLEQVIERVKSGKNPPRVIGGE